MNQRRTVTLVAACALLLATAPLTLIFKGLLQWFLPMVMVVAFIVGAAMGIRALRGNALLQVLGMFAAFLIFCTWMFRSGEEFLGFLPSGETFAHFGTLLGAAGLEIREQAIPVYPSDGMVFIAVLGVGALAILTELFASILRAPAMVGVPLLTLYVVVVATMEVGLPWVLFIPGAFGYLWLLLTDNVDRVRHYGRRFSGDGRGIDRWEPSPLATTGRWLALIVIPAALVIPAVLPGVTSGLIDGFMNNGSGEGTGPGGTGVAPNRVDPVVTLAGELNDTQTTEMAMVRTDNPDPGYMKMWVAANLTEAGFTADLQPSDESTPVSAGISSPEVNESVPSKRWTATVSIRGLEDYALPLYGTPVRVNASDDWVYDPQTNTVSSVTTSTKDMEFDYEYIDYDYTPDLLRTAEDVSDSSSVYRTNTPVPENSYVADLVETLTADKETAYDKVRAIHDHFSATNGFSYKLETETGWSDSAIVNFLENKEGFCQQYAGAMAWMVRQADIPARVAIGLTRGNATSEGFRATNFNFHAWVEVYFEGFGWVPFDPTPSASVRTPSDYPWAPDPDQPADSEPGGNTNEGGPQEGNPNEGGPQEDPLSNNGQGVGGLAFDGREPPTVWPYWIAGAAVVALLLLLPALSRRLRRQRRLSVSDSDPAAASGAAWRELRDTLTDLRIPVDPAETPRVTADRLITDTPLSGLAQAGMRHMAAVEERARYAARPPSEFTLKTAVTAVRSGLIGVASPRDRLRADLLPLSVLSSWRQGLADLVGRVGDGVIHTRLGVGRTVRRVLPGSRRPA